MTATAERTAAPSVQPTPPELADHIRRRRNLWFAALGFVMVATAWSVWLRLSQGMSVTDVTSQMPWGAWVAFYIFFVGLSAGAFLLSSLVYVFGMYQFERVGRAALLSAIISMGVALAFIGFDLGRFERGPSTLLHFHWSSPLSWEVRFYILYIALLIGELALAIRVQKRRMDVHKGHRWMRILGTIGVPLAIFGVHGGTGTIFAVVKARGMWFGGLFPVIFVVSAIVSGTALLLLVYYLQTRAVGRVPDVKLLRGMGTVLAAALGIDLGLTFYEFLVPILASEHHDLNIIGIQAFGPMWWSFWIVQLLLGMLVPFVVLVVPALKRRTKLLVAAAALVIVGIMAVRFNIVVPPLLPPVIEGYPWNDYLPTPVEWGVSAFFIAGGMLVYSLIATWLPIHDPDPAEEPEPLADRPAAHAEEVTA